MRARLNTVTTVYAACPNCGFDRAHSVGHILADRSSNWRSSFGPWACDECGVSVTGKVNDDNSVDFELTEGQQVACYTLLKIEPQTAPVYFVISDKDYNRRLGSEPFEGTDYYYNEHTCPINWLRNQVVQVISEGDTDPHGLATYVNSMDVPPGFDESTAGDNDWRALFPEAFADQSNEPLPTLIRLEGLRFEPDDAGDGPLNPKVTFNYDALKPK